MQDSVREVDIAVYPGATAKVRYEPKGVVGCLSPFSESVKYTAIRPRWR